MLLDHASHPKLVHHVVLDCFGVANSVNLFFLLLSLVLTGAEASTDTAIWGINLYHSYIRH